MDNTGFAKEHTQECLKLYLTAGIPFLGKTYFDELLEYDTIHTGTDYDKLLDNKNNTMRFRVLAILNLYAYSSLYHAYDKTLIYKEMSSYVTEDLSKGEDSQFILLGTPQLIDAENNPYNFFTELRNRIAASAAAAESTSISNGAGAGAGRAAAAGNTRRRRAAKKRRTTRRR
jgi:hypothetical protein